MERTNGKPSDRQAVDEFVASKPAKFDGMVSSKRNVWGRRKPYILRSERWLWQQECARPSAVRSKVYA